MFTGIVERTGMVECVDKVKGRRSAYQMTVNLGPSSGGLKTGQSVALNGVCLTITKKKGSRCDFEMIGETITKTDLGNLKKGGIVNVERSIKAGDRLDGHFVLGHVDGVGTIKKIQKVQNEVRVWFDVPRKLAKYVVKKGSIALDGISLTVADVDGAQALVCLIPHTVEATNLKYKKNGDKINIETDILGKYILG